MCEGRADILQTLLDDPRAGPVTARQVYGAVTGGHPKAPVVRVLLANAHADMSLACKALLYAIFDGQVEIAQLLLADPRTDPTFSNYEAIATAIKWGRSQIVQSLLAHPRGDPSARCNAALQKSGTYANVGTLRVLLADPRIDPGVSDNAPIRLAANGGYAEAMRLLLMDPRVHPGIGGADALCRACDAYPMDDVWVAEREYLFTVKLLLADPRIDVASRCAEALTNAKEVGRDDIVGLLLKHQSFSCSGVIPRHQRVGRHLLCMRIMRRRSKLHVFGRSHRHIMTEG